MYTLCMFTDRTIGLKSCLRYSHHLLWFDKLPLALMLSKFLASVAVWGKRIESVFAPFSEVQRVTKAGIVGQADLAVSGSPRKVPAYCFD